MQASTGTTEMAYQWNATYYMTQGQTIYFYNPNINSLVLNYGVGYTNLTITKLDYPNYRLAGLLPSIPTGCQGLYACKWVNTLYTGPILQLRITPVSTAYTQDFYLDSTGTNIGTLLGGHGTSLANWIVDNGGTYGTTVVYVAKWYDQSPTGSTASGKNATQTVVASQPKYDYANKYINFGVPTNAFFNLPDGTVPMGTSYTVTVKHGTFASRGGVASWLGGGNPGTNDNGFCHLMSGTPYKYLNYWWRNPGDFNGGSVVINKPITFKHDNSVITGNPPNRFNYIDNILATSAYIPPRNDFVSVDCTIGTSSKNFSSPVLNYYCNGPIYFLSIFNTALSDTDRTTMENIDSTNDLLFYYKFNSGDIDSSNRLANYATGTAVYDAVVYSGATIDTTTSKFGGGSLKTNGTSNGYVAFPTFTTTLNGVTISFWAKATTTTPNLKTILHFTNGTTVAEGVKDLIALNNQDFYIFNSTGEPNGNIITSPNNGNWTHYVFTLQYTDTTNNVDYGYWKFYVNGTETYSSSPTKKYYPRAISRSNNVFGKHFTNLDFCTGNFDEFRFYNRTLSATEVSNLYNYNGTDNTSIINNLIPGVTPWGIYDAANWSSIASGTGTLIEARNNGRNITTSGTITKVTASGNGATASIPYITGTTATTLTWPSGSIATNFTICGITRYSETQTTKHRILTTARVTQQGTGNNWLLGHWNGYISGTNGRVGMAFFNNWKTITTANSVTVTSVNNWLVSCGSNNANPGGTANNYKNIIMNNIPVGVATGGTINQGSDIIGINLISDEISDFAFTYLVIYNSILTDAQMESVSQKLNNYLVTGSMQ